MVDIPACADELSAQWLTAVMRGAGTLSRKQSVVGFNVEPLGAGGVGLSGDTSRVVLEYAGDDAGPRSIIAKFPTAAIVNRGMVESLDCYAREIAFYRDLASQMPVRVPLHVGSAMDPGGPGRGAALGNRLIDRLPAWAHLAVTKDVTKFLKPSKRRYALLLEDLGGAGVVHDMVEPPSIPQVRRALLALADLHIAFWGRADLDQHAATRPLVTEIPRVYRSVFTRRCRAMAEARWAHWLQPADRPLLDQSVSQFVDDVGVVNERRTLVHGDPRSDNLLFSDDSLVVLDWALAAVGHPGYDVSYLLGSSVRSEHMGQVAELLEAYLTAMQAGGVDLAGDELRRGVLAATRTTIVQQVISLPVLQGEYGPNAMPADLWTPRLLALLGALA